MSGPKYVEFNVDCTEDERLEIIKVLNEANRNGKARGVTCTGSSNLNIRVDNYSNMSVSQIKSMVSQAKLEVARRKEEQRKEELRKAKEAEIKRIDDIKKNVEISSKAQLNLVNQAIKECESQVNGLKNATTGTKKLTQVSASGMAKPVEAEIDSLRKTKSEIEAESQRKLLEIENHKRSIQGHSTIESLNSAISYSPSGYLSTNYNADVKQSILRKIDSCKSTFNTFSAYLKKVESNIGSSDSFASLIRKLNIIIENTKIETIDDIQNCISEIKKNCQAYAGTQRAEEMRKITAFIEELEQTLRSISLTTGGGVKVGDGIDYKKLIDSYCSEINKNVESIRKLEHIESAKEKTISDMLIQIEIQKNSGYSKLSEAKINSYKQEISKLEIQCQRDNESYLSFKKTEAEYKKLQQRARFAGVDAGIDYDFGINTCQKYINEMKDEMKRMDEAISIVTRDGRACQIIASLVNKKNGQAGEYEILSDEIILGNNRCLRFTKPGCFGVVYEYIVEPNGNAKRDVRGVKLNGEAIIKEEELIKKKHTDCKDMEYLEKDFGQMGSTMKYTELKTPEESSDLDSFLELDIMLYDRYILQALKESERDFADEIVSRVKDGESYDVVSEEYINTTDEDTETGGSTLYADDE